MSITRGLRSHGRVAALLAGLALVLVATACDEPTIKIEYDDRYNLTRVRMGAIGGDTRALILAVEFVCVGDNLCRPDSVYVELTDYFGVLCPEGERDWIQTDSLTFNCKTDEAELFVRSEAYLPLPSVHLIGYRGPRRSWGPQPIYDQVRFDLSYDDMRRLGNAEEEAVLHIGEVQAPLPGGSRFWLQQLVSRIEEEANR